MAKYRHQNALGEKARQGYQQRAMAVEHYSTSVPIEEVEDKTKFDRRVLYRMIERAVRAHPDGRPWGFRTLVPGSHTKTYERRKASTSAGAGLASSFGQLLAQYPKLEQLLRQSIMNRDMLLVQRETTFISRICKMHTTALLQPVGPSG